MKRSVIILVVTMALSFGCAASKQSIIQRVDPVSVRDAGRLDQDAAECLKYAEWAADECKKQAGINLGAGAVVGAGVGALVGLIVGHNTAGMASAIGALSGGVSAAASTRCKTEAIAGNCLVNRGYRLLWY